MASTILDISQIMGEPRSGRMQSGLAATVVVNDALPRMFEFEPM